MRSVRSERIWGTMARAARRGHVGARRAWSFWLWMGVWAGCSASYPDGKILCSDADECPSGFTCRTRDAADGERFCFANAAAEPADSGPQPSTSGAAVGGHEAATGTSEVAPVTDGGPTTTTAGSSGSSDTSASEAAGSGSPANEGDASFDPMDAAVAGHGGNGGHGEEAGMATGDAGHCDDATAECDPGTSETQMLPCGSCNTGVQRAQRSCGTDCRWGTPEPSGQCTNVTAACEPGDEKPESRGCACGRTQSRTLTCSDSCTWVEGAWGECDLSGVECLPGDTMPETQACECGRTQSRTMTCSDSCTWTGGAWGECDLAGVQCKPGQTQMQTVACASCGTRVQQRSCAANSCTWGGWSDLSSACASSCDDCAEVQFCQAPSNQPNPGGTKCRQTSRACTREQALADCQADIPVVCGTVHQPFYMQYL